MKSWLAQIELNIQEAAIDKIPGATADFEAEKSFGNLISAFLSVSMTVASLLLLLYLVWGAFEWLTSGGDKGKTEGARNRITNAIIGIVVLSSVVAIFSFVQTFLGVELINFNFGAKTPSKKYQP